MLVSFLHPYQYRAIPAPHLWVLYKQITHFFPNEIVFVGGGEYFKDPGHYKQQGRFELGTHSRYLTEYDIPSSEVLAQYEQHALPEGLFRDLEATGDSLVVNMARLLNERYPPLEKALERIFKDILSSHSVEAILCWCNAPSLLAVARELGLPVIHNELGPLRKPDYYPTAYFDFQGVNGSTEAESRFERFLNEYDGQIDVLGRDELLKGLGCRNVPIVPQVGHDGMVWGVPLQVEDDSNLIAYSNGYDNESLLDWVGQHRGSGQVLVRKHPAGLRDYKPSFYSLDQSANALVFLDRCTHVATINSSVGYEAMLRGKETTILGDSPVAFLSRGTFSSGEEISSHEQLLGLNFIAFAYLVPYEFFFDSKYLAWRLTRPSEVDIYRFHRKYYLEKNRFENGWFRYEEVDDELICHGLRKYLISRRYDAFEADVLRKDIDGMKSTFSWRLTRPLRTIRKKIEDMY